MAGINLPTDTAFLEHALGARTAEKLAGEFYAQAAQSQTQEGRTG